MMTNVYLGVGVKKQRTVLQWQTAGVMKRVSLSLFAQQTCYTKVVDVVAWIEIYTGILCQQNSILHKNSQH